MLAIVQDSYGSADVLQPAQIDPPRLGARDVLIEVRAAGMDRGTWHLMSGRPYLVRAVGPRRPRNRVPGLDVAGTVRAIGADVTRLAVGDEVFGVARGSFAELAVAREGKLSLKPSSIDFTQAAVLPVSGSTALQAVVDAGRVQAGQRVLITGASGGVGAYAVQLAAGLGADVTAECSAEKGPFVAGLGATTVLDYRVDDAFATAQAFDVIIDIAGTAPISRVRRALTPRGVAVLVGGEQGGSFAGSLTRQMGGALLSPFVSQRLVMLTSVVTAERLATVSELVMTGRLVPTLDHSLPLAQASEAMRLLESGQVRGKIALFVPADPGAAAA